MTKRFYLRTKVSFAYIYTTIYSPGQPSVIFCTTEMSPEEPRTRYSPALSIHQEVFISTFLFQSLKKRFKNTLARLVVDAVRTL